MASYFVPSLTRYTTVLVATLALVPGVARTCHAQNSADCSQPFFAGTAACQQANGNGATSPDGRANRQQPMQNGVLPSSNTMGNQPGDQRQPGNAQVYIDAAGNRWDRTTVDTDRNPLPLPPDPITDLQRLAKSSTGEVLTVFGRDLFQNAPSTFAPADQIPAVSDYIVGPGDEILVRLFGADSVSSNSQLTVDAAGNIYIPRIGPVQVAGLHVSEIQARITAAANHVYRDYRLSVSLGHLRSIQVYVVGEARRPGAYTISALSTMLNALIVSGGPNVQGSLRKIQLRRADGSSRSLDLYDLILRGDKSQDSRLQAGDTIFIPAVGPQVALAGSVRHPAIYELKDGQSERASTTLEELLKLAGGISVTGDPGKIRLERIGSDLERHAMTVLLDASGSAMPLRDGDVLYANHIAAGYEQSVTIRGNLANPGRFAWHPGMRLSDIIPDRSSLLTSNYWRERNQLGVPTPLFQASDFDSQTTLPSNVSLPGVMQRSADNTRGENLVPKDVDPGRPTDVDDTIQNVALAAGGVVSSSTLEMDQAAKEAASRTPDNRASTNLGRDTPQPSDGRSSVPSQTNQQVASSVTAPLRVRIPAPEIDWSYAVIERLDPTTLRSSLLPFNLGRLIQDHDSTQDLALQPGDVVTILNQRDILVPQREQTKYVRLEGEFAGAGVYSVGPGETLEQLVRRAGGFTPSAYLYGSSFQRESARAFQQQRLDEYITRLSTEMERATAERGASTTTGISDPNALTLERNIISQLRQLRATGRVVMEFKPDSIGVDALPHIALENGDVFRVPSRPDNVSVLGAVYGQNVFLYSPSRHLADYVALAGRPNRIADKSHAFIIRADGSIYSRESAKGVFSNHFEEARVYPGDAIVVPERLIKPTALRQLLDYSQVLSSFGLAAAAINVVR